MSTFGTASLGSVLRPSVQARETSPQRIEDFDADPWLRVDAQRLTTAVMGFMQWATDQDAFPDVFQVIVHCGCTVERADAWLDQLAACYGIDRPDGTGAAE